MSYLDEPRISSILYALGFPPQVARTGFGTISIAGSESLPDDLKAAVKGPNHHPRRLPTTAPGRTTAGLRPRGRQHKAPSADHPPPSASTGHRQGGPVPRPQPESPRRAMDFRSPGAGRVCSTGSEDHTSEPQTPRCQEWSVGEAWHLVWDDALHHPPPGRLPARDSRQLMLRTQMGGRELQPRPPDMAARIARIETPARWRSRSSRPTASRSHTYYDVSPPLVAEVVDDEGRRRLG